MKKKWLAALAAVVLLTGVLVSACSIQPAAVQVGLKASQQEGIWVTGQGKVTTAPDLATLSLGIVAQANTVAEAQAKANEAMNKVMAALTAQGVASKDIQTQSLSIQPITRYDKDKQIDVITGYQVSNIVTAKIRQISKAGQVIDAAAAAGGDLTRVNGISFSVADPTPFYKEARDKAMADAQAKADQMAKLAGVGLGKPTYISESSVMPPVPYPVRAGMDAAAGTPISPGEIDITLTVQVAYAIR